ncbi:hypothetical protein [Enterococcus raffinosus]|nr:hypothetical protein [Enterococcus raffinosus]UXK04516.1 hypothetical protein N7K38_01750 [Enterococcus raffinosus]
MAMKGKSKFDFEVFNDEGFAHLMAFNQQNYTKEQAIKEWRSESMLDEGAPYMVEEAFVRYHFGIDEDNELRNCWWLERRDYGQWSVPVWSIKTPIEYD